MFSGHLPIADIRQGRSKANLFTVQMPACVPISAINNGPDGPETPLPVQPEERTSPSKRDLVVSR
jgi:hypothetical protein